ncbi:MAG: hypothetical protein HOF88_03635 [Euryarchaeota archaeon]|nr:hypothetical protein [Euryarchaeota archaeon]
MTSKTKTIFAILLMITFSLAGCTGSQVIDESAREDIENLSASNNENQTNLATGISNVEIDITALSTSLGTLSGDLTNLGNELTVKETSLLATISIAEESIASLEEHNSALLVTLSGMNDSNSDESNALQLQINENNLEITSLELALVQVNSDLVVVQNTISSLNSTVTNLESTLVTVEQSVGDNSLDITENNEAIYQLSEQLNILSEEISLLEIDLQEALSILYSNPNHDIFNDMTITQTEEYDFDGDGIIDYTATYRMIVLACSEITFEDLSNIDFSGGQMSSTDFRYVDLSFSNLSDVYAEPTTCDGYMTPTDSGIFTYNGTIWDKTMFLHSDLSNVVANNMYAPSIAFAFSNLDDADFTDSYFSNDSSMSFIEDFGTNGSLFDMNSAIGAIFDNAYLSNASLYGNNFTSASFIDAYLDVSEIEMNDFTDADFTGTDLSNGTGYDNVWDGADFSYADLTDSDFDFSGSTGITWYFTTCSDGSNTGSSGSC